MLASTTREVLWAVRLRMLERPRRERGLVRLLCGTPSTVFLVGRRSHIVPISVWEGANDSVGV